LWARKSQSVMLWMVIFRLNGSVMTGRVGVTINATSQLPDQESVGLCFANGKKDKGSPPFGIFQICLHDDRLRIEIVTGSPCSWLAFLDKRITTRVIMRSGSPERGEQAWGLRPTPTRKSFLWLEVDGLYVVRNNGVEQFPSVGLVIIV